MNWREGLRRVGIALGIVGACVATPFSYEQFTDVLSQRKHFQQQIAEDKRLKKLWSPVPNAPAVTPNVPPPPPGFTLEGNKATTKESKNGPWERYAKKPGNPDTLTDADFAKAPDTLTDADFDALKASPGGEARPVRWYSFLVPALWPVAAFLIPWGAVKAIVWVLAGFVGSAPSVE